MSASSNKTEFEPTPLSIYEAWFGTPKAGEDDTDTDDDEDGLPATSSCLYWVGKKPPVLESDRPGVNGAGDESRSHDMDGTDLSHKGVKLQRTGSYILLKDNGFTVEISAAQRKYVGQCGKLGNHPVPGLDCEVYCGKLPKDVMESELVPLFEQFGTIWDLRLMMNSATCRNRGFAFIKYTDSDAANRAIAALNNYPIRGGSRGKLQVELCKPKVRLFIGNIPKALGQQDLHDQFSQLTKGLKEVIIYKSPDDKKKNRGFCFLDYESHACAFIAKRVMTEPKFRLWNLDIIVDWADPVIEPDNRIMEQVKILYVRNLTLAVTEEHLKKQFGRFGDIERVKKIKDYAFVHFSERKPAERALAELQGKEVGGTRLEIMWSKPPLEKTRKEEILRARERRMLDVQSIQMPGCVQDMSTFQEHVYGQGMGAHQNYNYQDREYYDPYAQVPPAHHQYYHPCHYDMNNNPSYYGTPPRSNDYYCGSESPFHDYYGSTTPPPRLRAGAPSSSISITSGIPPTIDAPFKVSPMTPGRLYAETERQGQVSLGTPGGMNRRKKRERIPAEVIDNDNNWRENSGPNHIDDFSKGSRDAGSWRK